MFIDISLLGESFLAAIFLLCSFATVFGLASLKLELGTAEKVLFWAKLAAFVAAAISLIVFILLVLAFLNDRFEIAVVSQYSSTNLPFFYKISAAWAGSAGSLLLWLTTIFLLLALWLVSSQVRGVRFDAVALSIAAGVCLGFLALLLFVAKPFAASPVTVDEGSGLNPLLQNFWMIIHPPLLFIGYSALLFPFVFASASVFTGRAKQPEVYQQLRHWLLLGICFLGLGIATGARWAYLELGWAGYWSWDPVENASLLPWILAVAALHSLIGIRISDRFRLWAIGLSPIPFILCLLATFITRSGILHSVHAFDYNVMFSALLAFIACCFLLWIACLFQATRDIAVVTPSQVGAFHSARGEALFWTNIILILTAAVIGTATLWPIISRAFEGSRFAFTLTREFYDRIIAVSGIVLAFMVGFVSLAHLQQHRSFIPLALTCCVAGLFSFAFMRRFGGVTLLVGLACGISAFSFVAILMNLLSRLKIGIKISSPIAHLGLLVLLVAAAISSSEQVILTELRKAEKITLAGYELVYDSFQNKTSNGITKTGPQFLIRKKDMQKKLWPHNSLYQDGRSTAEVAVHTGLLKDIYISFDGMLRDGRVRVTIKAKPLMFWVWLGALLIVAGSALAMIETKKTTKTNAGQPEPNP
jgi:c-type cytochrome biogenesis protein CcmF